jgi:hypothetical protein
MHNNIIEPVIDYDFSKVQLGIPVSHPNSTFVSRIFLNNKPLYIQTPKCTTKNGIVTSGKKIYCDLMFSSDDSIFIDWVTNLELKCQLLICNKSVSWFETEYTKDDIETAFSSPLKIYKSGKYYLLRVNIKPTMKIYNDLNAEVSFNDIDENVNMITVIEFYGIKFTSRNFQIEVELKQSMIVSKDEFVGNCFINRPVIQQSREKEKEVEKEVEKVEKEKEVELDQPKYIPREPDEPPQLLSNIQSVETETETEKEIEKENDATEELPFQSNDLELSEFEFDAERLEESVPLQLKRPIEQYYKEYNDLIEQANKLKKSLTKIYSLANNLKETHSLNVNNIEQYIYSDIDILDNEDEDEDDNV